MSASKLSDSELELQEAEKECSAIFKRLKEYERLLNQQKELYNKAKERLALLKKEKHLESSNKLIADADSSIEAWHQKRYAWSDRVEKTLKSVFKMAQFRPVQLAAINACLSKRDVVLVMPTGAGKSLIFQLTGVMDAAITIVVSPLISLMEDQVMNMKKWNIEAKALHSNVPKRQTKQIRDSLKHEDCTSCKFLYLSPEWLAKSKNFMQILKTISKSIARVVIDEVHCCSSWGHDFRPDYNYLGILRKTLNEVPFLCLTATATPSVLADVIAIINLNDPVIMTQPINRPNLYYEIKEKLSNKNDRTYFIANYITTMHPKESGIIYTNTVSECISLREDLQKKGIAVGLYYGNMEHEGKEIMHKKWTQNKINVIVATNAFGMGIDKPDVRFVIHLGLPRSIENMYQESGRAGRDGKPADCLILYNLSDFLKLYANATSVEEASKHLSVLLYCLEPKICRRVLLNKAFKDGSKFDCNKMCDHCRHPKNIQCYNVAPVLKDIILLLKHVRTVDSSANSTLKQLLDALFKKGPVKFRLEALKMPRFSTSQAELIISFLISKHYLALERGFTPYAVNCYIVAGEHKVAKVISMQNNQVLRGLEIVESSNAVDLNSSDEDGPSRSKISRLE